MTFFQDVSLGAHISTQGRVPQEFAQPVKGKEAWKDMPVTGELLYQVVELIAGRSTAPDTAVQILADLRVLLSSNDASINIEGSGAPITQSKSYPAALQTPSTHHHIPPDDILALEESNDSTDLDSPSPDTPVMHAPSTTLTHHSSTETTTSTSTATLPAKQLFATEDSDLASMPSRTIEQLADSDCSDDKDDEDDDENENEDDAVNTYDMATDSDSDSDSEDYIRLVNALPSPPNQRNTAAISRFSFQSRQPTDLLRTQSEFPPATLTATSPGGALSKSYRSPSARDILMRPQSADYGHRVCVDRVQDGGRVVTCADEDVDDGAVTPYQIREIRMGAGQRVTIGDQVWSRSQLTWGVKSGDVVSALSVSECILSCNMGDRYGVPGGFIWLGIPEHSYTRMVGDKQPPSARVRVQVRGESVSYCFVSCNAFPIDVLGKASEGEGGERSVLRMKRAIEIGVWFKSDFMVSVRLSGSINSCMGGRTMAGVQLQGVKIVEQIPHVDQPEYALWSCKRMERYNY